jgi:signal transduction histidine kinase
LSRFTVFHARDLLRAAEPFLGSPPDLNELRDILVPRAPEIVEQFYATIVSSPDAVVFIQTPQQLANLHRSLEAWVQTFFSAPALVQKRAELALRMTRTHLEIGMPLELTMLGHLRLRRLMLRELFDFWPSGDRLGLGGAAEKLNHAFDYDLLLLTTCYHGMAVAGLEANSSHLNSLNDRLAQSLKAQESLLRTTSHELRTPLAGLVGMLKLLRRGTYQNDPQSQLTALDDSLAAANHLLALTDDLLHLARLDLGRDRFDLQEFDARAATREVLRRFEPRAIEMGVNLHLEDGPPLLVQADRDRHAQVLSNLIQNAIRHAPHGRIEISLVSTAQAGHVLTRIHDNGEGIDPDLLPRLFQPMTSTERGGSLGLGLTICRRLVVAMGGRIRAHSNGPGQGASFDFTLPAGDAPALISSNGPDGAECTILLVDPDARWSNEFSRWLANALHAQVHCVPSSLAALEWLQSHSPHLILAEVALPATHEDEIGDGLALLEELSHHPAAMLLPKWLLSGHDLDFMQDDLPRGSHDQFWGKDQILGDRQAFLEAVRECLV